MFYYNSIYGKVLINYECFDVFSQLDVSMDENCGFLFLLTRCQPCACDPMGSVNGSCHPDSGVCVCKLLVTGDKCDVCQPGAIHFDPENHFGCSKGLFLHFNTYKCKSTHTDLKPSSLCAKLTCYCSYIFIIQT